MAKQTINLGTPPTGVGGDTSRSGVAKLQANDDELYTFLGAADGTLTTEKAKAVMNIAGHAFYQTLADAQASLPANTVVEITNDGANNGTYQWNGTTLTKSAYDPLTQAKAYIDDSVKIVASDSNLVHKNLAKNADFADGINGVITLGGGGFNTTYPQIPNYFLLKSASNSWVTQAEIINDYWKVGTTKSFNVTVNRAGTNQDLQLLNVIAIPDELIGKSDIDITVCIPYLNNNSNIGVTGVAYSSTTSNMGGYVPVPVTQKYPVVIGKEATFVYSIKITDPAVRYVALGIRVLATVDVSSTVKIGGFAEFFDRPSATVWEPSVYTQDKNLATFVGKSFPVLNDTSLVGVNTLSNAALLDSVVGSNTAPVGWSLASGGAGTISGVSTIEDHDNTLNNQNANRVFSVAHYNNGTVRTDKHLVQSIAIPTHLVNSGKKIRVVQWCKRSSDLVDFSLIARWKNGATQLSQFAPLTVINQPVAGQWGVMVLETTHNMANATHLEVLFRTQVSANSGIVSGITTKQTLFAVFLDAVNDSAYDRNLKYDIGLIAKSVVNDTLNTYVPPPPYDNDLYTNSLGDLEKAFPNKTLINMGDSQFNSLYTQLSAAFAGRAVINGGVGGERTDQILGRLDGATNHTNSTGWTNGQTVKLKAGLNSTSRETSESYRSTWADYVKQRAVPQKISFMRGGTRIASAYSTNRRTVTATVSGTTFTAAGHGFELWDRITPNSATLPAGMVKDKVYWVRDVTADTFTLAELFQGGSAATWSAFGGSIDFLSEYEVSWVYDGGDKNITAIVNSSWDYSTMLIGGGTNDIVQGKTFTEITANIRACVNHGKTLHKRVVVSGIPCFYESTDDAAWKIGGAKHALMLRVNNWIKQEYPLNYVDPYSMLLASGDGSANDNEDIAVGLVPRSLRVATTDGHINEAGNTLRVNQIKSLMTALKW